MRLSVEMLERLAQEEQQSLSIDGIERRIQRPQDDEQQHQYYIGKKTTNHTGKKHDKKICDEEAINTTGKRAVSRYGLLRSSNRGRGDP